MSAYHDAIAANRGPYFSRPDDMVVEVVEPGTVIHSPTGGEALEVHPGVAVRRSRHLFVTQDTWDAMMRHPNVRTVR